MEFTLLHLHKELIVEETLKNMANMLDVRLHVRREDEDIVQVDKDEHVEHLMKDVINQDLKHSWSISESKRH